MSSTKCTWPAFPGSVPASCRSATVLRPAVNSIATSSDSWAMFTLSLRNQRIIAVVLERNRYRSEAAERAGAPTGPGGGEEGPLESRFQRTDEVFVDPTSGIRMRVYADLQTGERRYRAEGDPRP